MNTREAQGIANAIVWFAILAVSGLFQSEIGGPGSYFNAIDVALIALFVAMNRRVDKRLALAFGVPLGFLALSVISNTDTLHAGGYRSAGAISAGYLLFTLKPVPLHHVLLRRLVTVYVVTALALSIVATTRESAIGLAIGNKNFNVNPNGASLFFVANVMLSLWFVRGWRGWALATPFMLLVVTTWSRGGAICTGILILGYSLFFQRRLVRKRKRVALGNVASNWQVWAMLVLIAILAVRFIPGSVNAVIERFQIGTSRSEQWNDARGGIRSLGGFLFGYGPATLSTRTGDASHSSYLEAIGNSGIFFLVSSLGALLYWLRRSVKDGALDLLWVVPPVLVYGLVEVVLFNGIGTLWLLTMLLGLAIRSDAARLDISTPVPASRRKKTRRVQGAVIPISATQ